MPTALVTGANRGIGLEFARQYAGDGWRVLVACRDPERATALQRIGGKVEIHKLDVTDADQLAALARALKGVPIDLLVNNAGVHEARDGRLGRMDYAGWADMLAINTLAPFRVTEALLPNVLASGRKLIVSISSRLGSIGLNEDGAVLAYRSSKAALNQVMRSLAADLRPKGAIVVVLAPGWVKTDMGGPGAPVGVEDSVAGMRSVIARLGPADSGRFFSYDGTEIPW